MPATPQMLAALTPAPQSSHGAGNPAQVLPRGCPAKRMDGARRQPGLQLSFLRTCLRPHVALGTPRGIWPWREQWCTRVGLSLVALEPGCMARASPHAASGPAGAWGGCVRVRCMSVCAGAGLHVRAGTCANGNPVGFASLSSPRPHRSDGSSAALPQHPGLEFSPSLLSPLS